MMIPDPSALQELVQQLHRHATPWLPAGLGSRLHWGPPVQPGPGQTEPLVLSTARLDRIVEHCVGDFTVTVQAGVPLQQLQQELAARGQWLALDWPWGSGADGSESGTVGGLVARGLAGGLRQRYLGVRDQLIGLSLMRADGTAAKAGGRVVKNVAGYDLMRLFTGSWGSLGLITELTLRTLPQPRLRRGLLLQGPLPALERLRRQALASPLMPELIEWWRPAGSVAASAAAAPEAQPALLIGLASISAEAIAEQLGTWCTSAEAVGLQAESLDPEALACRRADTPGSRANAGEQRWLLRLGLLPAQLHELLADTALLQGLGYSLVAGSGLGMAWGSAAAVPAYRVEALRRRCKELGGDLGGTLTVLEQPSGSQLPAWENAPSRPLIEAVKRQFDPLQQLARGRLPGVQA
ncbi:MAG: FAD-binding oxidoreductase [Synechococcaceae bacterium WB8_1B_136]|nr:FAD-binding oxidoreductase [Synechococcaceae bacterium WB8_1B_136]